MLVVGHCPELRAPLAAHDMWIEPTTFSPEPARSSACGCASGRICSAIRCRCDPALVNQFVVEDAAGRKPVVGRDGADPAGFLRVAQPGLLVIGYRSNPSAVEMPAEKFNQYLKEEGLDAVAALRARRNETGAAAHELFSRCAKSLVLSGSPSEHAGRSAARFTLELVAERNPYAIRAGQDLPVRLTYENRPLAGALVVAMNRLNPAEKLSARTDNDGRVRFRLRPGGMWLVKAVHMVPAPAGANAEWASFWASLTFEMPTAHNARKLRPKTQRAQGDVREDCLGQAFSLTAPLVYGPALCAAVFVLLCSEAVRAHEIGTTRVSVLFDEGRTYDIEIVTDAAALVEKLEASAGPVVTCRHPSGSSPVSAHQFRRDVSPASEDCVRRVGRSSGDRVFGRARDATPRPPRSRPSD